MTTKYFSGLKNAFKAVIGILLIMAGAFVALIPFLGFTVAGVEIYSRTGAISWLFLGIICSIIWLILSVVVGYSIDYFMGKRGVSLFN